MVVQPVWLPQPGADVLLDDTVIGFLGTAVQHYELGPIALAVLKRSLDPDSLVTCAGMNAHQEVIVQP